MNRLLKIALLLILGVGAYSNTFQSEWHFDDIGYIVHNPDIRDITDVSAIFSTYGNPARFIPYYTFALNYHFHQYNVVGYHVVNLVIHLINALLVWWMASLILSAPAVRSEDVARHKQSIAYTSALIFMAHPLQTQAVTYITQRFTSLATLFYVLSLCLYLKGRLSTDKGRGCFILAGVSAVLGMFTKQIVITLPLAAVLIELCFFDAARRLRVTGNKKIWVAGSGLLVFLLIVPAIYSFDIMRILGMKASSGSHRGEILTAGTYLLTQFRVLVTYLRLMLFPIGQNLLYDFQASRSFFEFSTLSSFAVLILVLAAGLKIFQKYRLISFGIFWFFVTVSVESSIIPIRHVIFEHRCYLPMVGFALAASCAFYSFMGHPSKRKLAVSAVVAVLTVLTYQRNFVWQDGIRMWQDVISKSPDKTRPYMNLGIAYSERGKLGLAMEQFNRALTTNPSSTLSYNNRGTLFNKMGKYEMALADFNKALGMNQSHAEIFNNRGDTYRMLGRFEEALADYDRALALDTKLPQTFANRGIVQAHLGRYESALKDYTRAIRLDPYYYEAYNNRGNLYGRMRKYDAALADFNKALALNPESAEAYNNRGNVYRRKEMYGLAVRDYQKAIEIQPEYAQAHNNLAVIFKIQGEYDKALKHYNKAIELDQDYHVAYGNRANLFNLLGQKRRAVEDLSRALEIAPAFIPAYYNRGAIYLELKEYDLALRDFERILEIDPHNDYARIQKSRAMEGRGSTGDMGQ